MNFSKCNDSNWNDYQELSFNAPISFTMPDHDVLFANVAS